MKKAVPSLTMEKQKMAMNEWENDDFYILQALCSELLVNLFEDICFNIMKEAPVLLKVKNIWTSLKYKNNDLSTIYMSTISLMKLQNLRKRKTHCHMPNSIYSCI